MTNSSREIDLLLDCTRLPPDEATIHCIRASGKTRVDWSEFIRLALPHGILPLAAWTLEKYAASEVPPETLAPLTRYRLKVEARNRQHTAELVRLVDLFISEGIRVLPFKGPQLAVAAYDRLWQLRECHDLDFWVDPNEFVRAIDLLRSSRYSPAGHVRGEVKALPGFWKTHTEFISPRDQVLIELHNELQSAEYCFAPLFDEIWDRRQYVSFAEARIPAFAPEDLVPALAVHACKHRWRRLTWIVDIAGLVHHQPGLDWGTAVERAEKWGCRGRLQQALALPHVLYDAELPAAWTKWNTRHAAREALRVKQRLFQEPHARTTGSFSQEVLDHLRLADTWPDRWVIARHTMRRILRADETKIVSPLSGSIRVFYAAVRFIRQLQNGLRRLLGQQTV